MTEIHGAPPKESRFFANFDVSVVVVLLLAAGFAITFVTVGPWEAIRNFGVEALILGASFWVARQYLPWEDAPRERIKKPLFELAAGLAAYVLLLYGSDRFFRGDSSWALFAAGMLIPVAVLLAQRYSADAWGLKLPRTRDWLVALAVAAIVFAACALGNNFLPEGEIPGPAHSLAGAIQSVNNWPVGDVGEVSNGDIDTLLMVASPIMIPIALIVAGAVELFFRVYLQPRLAAFMSGRWALFWQAVLYSLMFMPMYMFANGYSLPYSLALTMVLSNGILAGYFWRKTGSLPLLIVLNLLAFTRWGL